MYIIPFTLLFYFNTAIYKQVKEYQYVTLSDFIICFAFHAFTYKLFVFPPTDQNAS